MNIHEFQAKQLFKDSQSPAPEGMLATTVAEAKNAASALEGASWAVKAQVHAGGRGKVGGVKIAHTVDEVAAYAEKMLGQRLTTQQTGVEGLPINSVLIERTSEIKREFYLSLLLDRQAEKLCFTYAVV